MGVKENSRKSETKEVASVLFTKGDKEYKFGIVLGDFTDTGEKAIVVPTDAGFSGSSREAGVLLERMDELAGFGLPQDLEDLEKSPGIQFFRGASKFAKKENSSGVGVFPGRAQVFETDVMKEVGVEHVILFNAKPYGDSLRIGDVTMAVTNSLLAADSTGVMESVVVPEIGIEENFLGMRVSPFTKQERWAAVLSGYVQYAELAEKVEEIEEVVKGEEKVKVKGTVTSLNLVSPVPLNEENIYEAGNILSTVVSEYRNIPHSSNV